MPRSLAHPPCLTLRSTARMPHGRHPHSVSWRKHVSGQAMIEYMVVLSFAVIVLMKGSGTEEPPVKQLAMAIKNYHKHYSFAMSIASIPDCNYQFAYDKSVDVQYIGNLTTISVTGNIDRCVDWQNPKIPFPTGVTLGGLGITSTNVKSIIQNMVTNMVSDALSDFVSPGNLLDDMVHFSPSSFF